MPKRARPRALRRFDLFTALPVEIQISILDMAVQVRPFTQKHLIQTSRGMRTLVSKLPHKVTRSVGQRSKHALFAQCAVVSDLEQLQEKTVKGKRGLKLALLAAAEHGNLASILVLLPRVSGDITKFYTEVMLREQKWPGIPRAVRSYMSNPALYGGRPVGIFIKLDRVFAALRQAKITVPVV